MRKNCALLFLSALIISGCAPYKTIHYKVFKAQPPPLPPLSLKSWSTITPNGPEAILGLNTESAHNLAHNLTVLEDRIDLLEAWYYGEYATATAKDKKPKKRK